MIWQTFMFMGGFVLLIIGADWLTKAGSAMAVRYAFQKYGSL